MPEIRELTTLIDSAFDNELGELASTTFRDKRALARDASKDWMEVQEYDRYAEEIIRQEHLTIPLGEMERSLEPEVEFESAVVRKMRTIDRT